MRPDATTISAVVGIVTSRASAASRPAGSNPASATISQAAPGVFAAVADCPRAIDGPPEAMLAAPRRSDCVTALRDGRFDVAMVKFLQPSRLLQTYHVHQAGKLGILRGDQSAKALRIHKRRPRADTRATIGELAAFDRLADRRFQRGDDRLGGGF